MTIPEFTWKWAEPTEQPMPWRVSFGVQYRPFLSPHPTYPKGDGRGYVIIMAHSEDEARAAAISMFGTAWAFIYPPDQFMQPQFFPHGCIETFHADEVLNR